MKKTSLIIVFYLLLNFGYGQSSYTTAMNYIVATEFLKEGITSSTDINNLEPSKLAQTVQYFDGLGRQVQTVKIGNSPFGMDMIFPVAYDEYGREVVKYLPYARNIRSGQYASSALTEHGNFYQSSSKVANDRAPFQKFIFESSPLNRVIKTGAPGEAWQPLQNPVDISDKSVKIRYAGNAFGEVLRFKYDASTEQISVSEMSIEMYYQANTLFKHTTIDEHNNEIIEFVDNEGRILCKKVQFQKDGYAITYYVYDDFGNLIAALPPEVVKRLTE